MCSNGGWYQHSPQSGLGGLLPAVPGHGAGLVPGPAALAAAVTRGRGSELEVAGAGGEGVLLDGRLPPQSRARHLK